LYLGVPEEEGVEDDSMHTLKKFPVDVYQYQVDLFPVDL
jgi:hypothetical protein